MTCGEKKVEAFLSKGIIIEILFDSMGSPSVLIRLLKKPYPSAVDRKIREKQKEIEMKN
jgi:hypothetical protein